MPSLALTQYTKKTPKCAPGVTSAAIHSYYTGDKQSNLILKLLGKRSRVSLSLFSISAI